MNERVTGFVDKVMVADHGTKRGCLLYAFINANGRRLFAHQSDFVDGLMPELFDRVSCQVDEVGDGRGPKARVIEIVQRLRVEQRAHLVDRGGERQRRVGGIG